MTRGRGRLLPAIAVAASAALASPVAGQVNPPGGFLELATSAQVRSLVTPVLPDRGPFLFPAPYGTQGVRVTNASDCNGSDCLNSVGYSYWRNTNNHVGSNTMLIVLTLDRSRGGNGPTLFSYDKTTNQVQNVGPLFDPASSFSWATGEGWYWSPTQPTVLYIPSGRKLYRYEVSTRQFTTVFDITTEFGANRYIWQAHTSHDDMVHSATLRSSTTFAMLGCLTYDERTAQFSYAVKTGAFDECQVDKSGQWLLIKEDADGQHAEDNVIYNLATGAHTATLLDQQGAAGHSDNGHGYVVGEDNWNAVPGAIRVWQFGQPLPGAPPAQGTLVYRTTDWAVDAGHISHANARPGVPLAQQYACLSRAGRVNLPRSNEIVCFRLDGLLQALVVAPVMTNLNASGGGGGGDYTKLPKGNLDVTGQYFIWTSNVGGNRLDAFVVKVPSHLLVAGAGGGTPTEPSVRPVHWTETVNVTVSGRSLQKTSGCQGCADAGALSKQKIRRAAGGSLQFSASETTTLRHVGLSAAATASAGTGLQFAVALRPGGVAEVRENGVYRADTRYVPGDVFTIAVEPGGAVAYHKNGSLLHRSTMAPTGPMRVNASLSTFNATIQNATVLKP